MQILFPVGGLTSKEPVREGTALFRTNRPKVQGVNPASTHLSNDCGTAKLVYKRIQQP